MEKHKKIIIVFILIFVQAFLIQYVYFRPDRSIIFGRNKTIETAKAEVKQVVHERYKSLADKHPAPLFLSIIITIWKSKNHNIYTKKLIIHQKIRRNQLPRKDLSGNNYIPVYGYENMI
ncbi:hypothetical protein GPK86_01600 [Blautia faecis]|jgi:hypothetical protein|uniref:hypothetical protein n=1 Tax=Blautia faecis TaxID=871665 RepID=UPI001C02CCA2|nr:hypothetical protein [Blautia faecis]MBT9855187.1 hypothetical protein [Blautia faecis]